jgi:phenylpropionate dioxygenase-like ring-hydroxylating dioxygenase large terminal subunit
MTELPPSVRDAWHLVALSRQVRQGSRLAVTVCGRSVVLFRGDQGLGALIDRCPHRNYPLSLGRVDGGAIECPYHGWRFAPSGQCVAVPGCALPAAAGKLAATPVRVAERHGGVFVRLSAEGPAEPSLPPTLGEPEHDHFWWRQGTWVGRAYDAIENVLDPFHTNHLHDGFIRRRDRRLPVKLDVNSFERGIEMVIEQTQPDLGLMSRFLERDRARSATRYYPPTVVQARWDGKQGLTLCVTAFFTPATDNSFTPFACFTTRKGLAPGWLKEAAIRLFLEPVVAQDRRALAAQAKVMAEFGRPQFVEGPGDILGNRLHRLWMGDRLEPGRDETVEAQL